MRTSLIFLSLLLCLAFLCGCVAEPVTTDPTEAFTEPTAASSEPTEPPVNFTHNPSNYWPVVYQENNPWLNELLAEYHPGYDFIPGYLYIMNAAGVKIITVLEETVKFIQETPNALFCVMADDSIIQTDYTLSYRKTIYEATRGPITVFERLEHTLYFVEGNYVIQLDIPAGTSKILLEHEAGIDTAFMTDWNTLLWRDSDWQHYVLDLATGTITPLTEIEYDMYFGTAITP